MSTLGERLVAVLKEHDLRRWMRMLKGDRSFDCLRCYCGEKIYEDSNEAMLGHVADALAAEVADAPLPLQRTLPDEQFKGAVVERIGQATRLEALTEEVELLLKMAKDCDARGEMQSPQKEWTFYQGKICAYEHVLKLLQAVAADLLMAKEPGR